MSVQFGRWNFDAGPLSPDYFERVIEVLAPYGPDGVSSYSQGGLTIIYRPFHTTKESRFEVQPYVDKSGTVIVWDGRLDNRRELLKELGETMSDESPDVLAVAAAYQQLGTACLPKLIGDWAFSAWTPSEASLLLAKDPVGSRHLYYSLENAQITWSTVIDPLVLFAGHSFQLNEEYIAGWLSFFPASRLTPYTGIFSVPPACFVRVTNGIAKTSKYWDFDPQKRIRYRSDTEYEEHFRSVLANAVRRRLRSDSPILAELSGGMDSSSIVCMADSILAGGQGETPRLDTVSYYDDSEPNWNERPYFTRIEAKRGRKGCHIDVRPTETLKVGRKWFGLTPTSATSRTEAATQFDQCVSSQGNRVILSGIGGDEVLGGKPTPIPELSDLLVLRQFNALAHQLKVWALQQRRPWFHIFAEVIREFLPPGLTHRSQLRHVAPWLTSGISSRNAPKVEGYGGRLSFGGALPSFQSNLRTLDLLRRQLACDAQPLNPLLETRYCYLDRDLLEFLYAVPREQLVRPGQRRSLHRRALAGLVPTEILNRKRKAFVTRSSILTVSKEWAGMNGHREQMVTDALGIVNQGAFSEAVEKAQSGFDVSTVLLTRTLTIESWLRHVRDCEINVHIDAGV